MPDCQQSTRTAGGSIIGQATAGYRPGERAPEPPITDVRQLDRYQADAHAGRAGLRRGYSLTGPCPLMTNWKVGGAAFERHLPFELRANTARTLATYVPEPLIPASCRCRR